MADSKQLRANQVISSEKENRPPTKTRRSVSISGLFGPKRHRRQKSDGIHDALAHKSVAVSKRTKPKSGPFVPSRRSNKAPDHPLHQSLEDATNEYRTGAAQFIAQQLEPVYNALIARVDGLETDQPPPAEPTTLLTAETEAFTQAEIKIPKPLNEHTFTVRTRQKNGTKQITLGQLMHSFEKVVEQKRARLEDLSKELQEVDNEMNTAYQNAVDVENGAVKGERRQLERDLTELANEAYEAKEQTLAEVKQAQEDERAATADEKRRLDEFLSSL